MFKLVLFLVSFFSILEAINWSDIKTISSENTNIQNVDIAIDNTNGEAVAVWDTYDGTNYSIQYSYSLDSLSSWSTPVTLSQNTERVDSPKIAITNDGKAIIIYRKLESNYFTLVERHSLDNITSWSDPNFLSDGTKHAYGAEIALTSVGDALVSWIEGSKLEVVISSSNFSNWSLVYQRDFLPSYLSDLKIVINDSDEAIICFKEFNFENYILNEIHSSSNFTAWSLPNKLSGNSNDVLSHKIVKNGNDVVVVFSRIDGNIRVVQEINSNNNLNSWSNLKTISEENQTTISPDLLLVNGKAYVVCQKYDESRHVIQLIKSEDLTNWTRLKLSNGSNNFLDPKISLYGTEAVSIWKMMNQSEIKNQESDSRDGITSWSTPIDFNISDSDFLENKIISSNNKLIVYWTQYVENQMKLQLKYTF